jgi:hypothetical protein
LTNPAIADAALRERAEQQKQPVFRGSGSLWITRAVTTT